jgi:hypothetical protein
MNLMKTPNILASSAALLLAIVGSAVGQDSPKPATESLDIPGLPGAAPAPKVIPAPPIVVVPEKLPPGDPGIAPTARPKPSSTPASANELELAQEAFVTGFLSARKAQEQDAAGDTRKAAENYRAAIETLTKIKEQWPTWQPDLVEFRLKRTQESLNKLKAKPITPTRTGKAEQREPKTSTGQSLIRETKLKVLQKHYESALNETIQLEKTALSAEPEERAKAEAKAKSMRDFLHKLEAELQTLTAQSVSAKIMPADTGAAAGPAAGSGVPGLPEGSAGERQPIRVAPRAEPPTPALQK